MLENFIKNRIISELPFEPNTDQIRTLDELSLFLTVPKERKCFILQGYAGTGKTSIVGAFVRTMNQLQKKFVLLAPTGRAAKVLSRYSGFPAFTIHKCIYRREKQNSDVFSIGENKMDDTIFVVDEASMISANQDFSTFGSGCLLNDLIQFIFSGKRCSMILLGDDAQLPPVGNQVSPALSTDFMEGYNLNVYNSSLTIVARQEARSGILQWATQIRNKLHINIIEADDVQSVNGETFISEIEKSYSEEGIEETLIITLSNRRTNLYNQGIRSRILWMENELSGGDRIMVSRNNYFWTEQYENLPFLANGDMFEVERITNVREMYGYHFADAQIRSIDYSWEIDVMVWIDTLSTDSPETSYSMQKDLFSKIAEDYPEIHNKKDLYEKIIASPYYNALQIRYAYAVTCHKAQGGQWKRVFIDPGPALDKLDTENQARWMYTAVTRATEKVFLLNNK